MRKAIGMNTIVPKDSLAKRERERYQAWSYAGGLSYEEEGTKSWRDLGNPGEYSIH